MRYWNVGDALMRRVLCAEFAALAPRVQFLAGEMGGIELRHDERVVGLWVEVVRQKYSFLAPETETPLVDLCDLVEAVDFTCAMLTGLGCEIQGRAFSQTH